MFLALVLGVALSQGFAQKKPKRDTTATRRWVREYLQQQLKPSIQAPSTVVTLPVMPPCKTGLDLLTVSPSADALIFTFQAVDVQTINWILTKDGSVYASGNTGKLTSAQVRLPQKITETGAYELAISAGNCSSDPEKGKKAFVVSAASAPNDVSSSKQNEGAAIELQPLKDPLLPALELTGNYELRYIESEPDEHLKLRISYQNGEILLTDEGSSLQSVSYTLNGWTDPKNCGQLIEEPIRPYRLYHLSKYSVDVPNIAETWKAEYGNPRAAFRRSELFFYVVPQSETWNPAGDAPNPIGRPAAFSRVPAFKLNTRVYGFEYEFQDETAERLDQLSIQFNRSKKHEKLYAHVLSSYLQRLPVRKGFHDLTQEECIDFANTIPVQYIVAFDIEPPAGEGWIINYTAPNFARNMGYVIERLKERGALAYNWLDAPDFSPNNISLDGTTLMVHGMYRDELEKYAQAYQRLGEIQKRYNPYSLVSTGYGYKSYDNNFIPGDGNGINNSPQITYLKALDASELWSRVFPDKQQVYFTWAFQEFDFYAMPPNHVVEIPEYNAVARRTDNKPLYPPNHWADNLTLGLITSKYLFYWSPGPVGWNPANTSAYNSAYTNGGFSVWRFDRGMAPPSNQFYIGKEALAINSTIVASYTFSQIEGAMNGERKAPKFTYQRAGKNGNVESSQTVDEINNGSWYVSTAKSKTPFALYCQNEGKKVLLVQDLWSRPGRYTDFEVEIEGRIYRGRTEGNRLFIAKLNW